MLFIFDNIWKRDYFKHLTFAKKSIVTSRGITDDEQIHYQYYLIPPTDEDSLKDFTVRDFHIYIIYVRKTVNRFSYDFKLCWKSMSNTLLEIVICSMFYYGLTSTI